jgi:hypothetical protein
MSNAWGLATGTNTPTIATAAGGKITMSDLQFLAIAGGVDGAALSTDGSSHMSWRVPAGGPGGLVDAPSDGTIYGRSNALWVNVLPLTGGILTGLLTLSGPPTAPLHAATKAYVDAQVSPVSVDGTSIKGNGTTTPLNVSAIDAGSY